MPLRALGPQHVHSLHAEMERKGASPAVRLLAHVVLRRALSEAARDGLVARNPCEGVPRPRLPRAEVSHLDADEVRRLLEAARGDPLEALVVLAVATGMRHGELLGLQWGDVDLAAGTLAVRRQLRQLLEHPDGSAELAPPKTARSRRQVELAVRALGAHRARLGAEPPPDALVFVGARGARLRKSNLLRRWFRPLLERAGVRRVRFHDLRHTHATLLLKRGVNPKVVQERLGHSQISVTLDTYSHVVPSLQRDAARRLDEALVG